MYASFWFWELYGTDPYVSVILIVPLAFIFGLIVERLVIEPVLDGSHLMQIFSTLGLSFILQNIALFVWRADYRSIVTPYMTNTIQIGSVNISFTRLIAFLAALIVTGGITLFLQKTLLGKAIRAVAQDRAAALACGINVRKIYTLTLGIGATCAGIAGALLMPIFYTFPSVGLQFNLIAFVVVVLGGLGSLKGALLGGIAIGIIEGLSGFYISPGLKEAVYFLMFVAILVARPAGLFGFRGAENIGLE
jgi:branched-chain amino acid transport system permease protein